MKKIVFLLFLLLALCSCTFSPRVTLKVSPYFDTPWEENSGKEMWYKVRYFDGEKVRTDYLDRGTWRYEVKVPSSSLLVFAFYPLGDMEPMGGFWEPGDGKEVWLSPEDGYFASMLIDASSQYPDIVSTLSIKALKKVAPDFGAIDRTSFLTLLIEGKLDEKEFELYRKYGIPLDGIPKGNWVSLYHRSSSIIVSDVFNPGKVFLFPGIYHYISFERDLMLTITINEEGRYWTRVSKPPLW